MKKWFRLIAVAVIAALFLTSCGAKAAYNGYDDYEYSYAAEPASGGYALDQPMEPGFYMDSEGGMEYTSEKPSSSGGRESGLILTFSADIDMETLNFDESMKAIQEAIKAAGGYISSQHQYGGYTNYSGYYVSQSVQLEIKIPAENFQEFISGADTFGNVKSVNSWQEDITGAYMDTKARLESLETQRQRLMAMMEQAETVSDLIQIEQQLSETIYNIESYTSRMKIYQSLADYSTVTIDLTEVKEVTVTPVTFGERIIETFRRTGRNIVSFCEESILVLIELLPLIVVLAVVILVICAAVKKRKARKQKEYEKWVQEQQALQNAQQAAPGQDGQL